jgi:hypothetical protein
MASQRFAVGAGPDAAVSRPISVRLLLDRVGIGALGLSAGLCLAASSSLFLLRPRDAVAARPSPARV